MLLPAIPLDAAMTASEALVRLARHGLWDDATHSAATACIEENRALLAQAGKSLTFEEAERRLHRSPSRIGVAIRRQWYGQILWYARPAEFVLSRLRAAAPADSVLAALDLHESGGQPPIPVASAEGAAEGVVVDQGQPVAISLVTADAPRRRPRTTRSATRSAPSRGTGGGLVPEALQMRAWPLLEAPEHVPAQTPFMVTVGFAADQQAGVAGAEIAFPAPPGADSVDLTVELIADGLDAPQGWTRPLKVAVADPTAARATFTLVGRAPAGTEQVHLTMIEVRYVLNGAVCGTASRPLEVRAAGYVPPDGASLPGTSWLAQPASTSAMTLPADGHAADLTIEIFRSTRSMTAGHYLCWLRSPHPLADPGPHNVYFGDDTKTFARTIVEQIRNWAGDPIVDNLLDSFGRAVTTALGTAPRQAIYDVAELTKPNPPTVMIVSAEPYVPWEIAVLDPPLDPELPPFLGVQTLLGRWLRERPVEPLEAPAGAPAAGRPMRVAVPKPPGEPPATIPVRHMAVMAGVYQLTSGLRPLPEAETEAKNLIKSYDAIQLSATSQSLKLLLDARLSHGLEEVGGASAVHFAGHGDFNPADPDASVMLLSDGRPMPSAVFGSAKYGGNRQPLIFLNACMIGIGGELLGAMGGFPGNCLRGGFGGVLGALWEVNDAVAREVAEEFWRRVLPRDGSAPEPVAAVLRDLRAQYDPEAPVPTYLSYVYYGHPRLTLQRVN